MTVYVFTASPWTPPASCWRVAESGKDPEQEPEPDPPDTDAELQFTRTAETGSVGQFEKLLSVAWMLTVQLSACDPDETTHDKVAGDDAATVPASGFPA